MAPSTRNRSERREKALQSLLGALEEMLEEGSSFTSIRIDALAARAGMSRANFYIHYQDKVELLEQWLERSRAALWTALDEWYAAEPTITQEQLRTAVLGVLSTYNSRLTLMTACREAALTTASLRAEFAEAFEVHVDALAAHIEAGQRSGVIDPALLPRETAEWLMCLMDRGPSRIAAKASAAELTVHASAAAGIIWSVLYADAPSN